MVKQRDVDYMRRCIELAERGHGFVNPNPMVGCVIVKGNKIIGEGFHREYGGPHAEVIAIRQAGKKSKGATLYVNLEPCSHHGKTPPCVETIIKSEIKRVVAATRDPNPLVSGKGFHKLRAAGILVETRLMADVARQLNEKFFTYMQEGIPYVALKIAQTLDGKIADRSSKSKWITGTLARKEVQKIRSQYDAVLVGSKTVLTDNPFLTVRDIKGRNPIRVVLDGSLKTRVTSRIYSTRDAATYLLTSTNAINANVDNVLKLEKKGVQVFGLDGNSMRDMRVILRVLANLGISSVLVEGGSAIFSAFLEQKLAKRMYCFFAPKILGNGLSSITFQNGRLIRQPITLVDVNLQSLGEDIFLNGKIKY